MRTPFATLSTLTVLALTAAGVTAIHDRRTHLTAKFGDHDISAVVDGKATLRTDRHEAVITSDFGALTIQPTRVLRNGKPIAEMGASASIEIDLSAHRLSVTAR